MLSQTQRSFLIRHHIIGATLFNALLNGFLAWLTFRHQPAVPIAGDPSVVGDAIGTAVLLPLLTCLIVTPLVRRAIAHGRVEPLSSFAGNISMVLWLPRLSFFRGLALSLLCLAWLTPLYLAPMLLADIASLSVGAFVFMKIMYAGVMAAWVAPVVALYVLATTPVADAADDEADAHASVPMRSFGH
jgi:hypothetical protein